VVDGAFETGGVRVPLDGYDGVVPASGAQAKLGVRPEHVVLRPGGDGGLPAVVDIYEPMGSDSLVWMSFAGQNLSARAAADGHFPGGAPVSVAFDIPKASLFDVKTEQRL
jgi:multiple sugar transport system ATP-binding protein